MTDLRLVDEAARKPMVVSCEALARLTVAAHEFLDALEVFAQSVEKAQPEP